MLGSQLTATGECGHFCPCRLHYRGATHAVIQCIKARVISRTDNWTLILVDIVVGMICQPDRAYVLTSADRPQTRGRVAAQTRGLAAAQPGKIQPLVMSCHCGLPCWNTASLALHGHEWRGCLEQLVPVYLDKNNEEKKKKGRMAEFLWMVESMIKFDEVFLINSIFGINWHKMVVELASYFLLSFSPSSGCQRTLQGTQL